MNGKKKMTEMTVTETSKKGQPWDLHKKYDSYEEADKERKKLLSKKKGSIEVRVRRRSDNTFDIKTRKIEK